MLRYALAGSSGRSPSSSSRSRSTFFLVRSTGGDPFRHGPLVGLTARAAGRSTATTSPRASATTCAAATGSTCPGTSSTATISSASPPSTSARRSRTATAQSRRSSAAGADHARALAARPRVRDCSSGSRSALVERARTRARRSRGSNASTSSLALSLPAFFVGTLLIYLVRASGPASCRRAAGTAGARRSCRSITLGLVPARLLRAADAGSGARDACAASTSARRGRRVCAAGACSSSTCSGTRSCRC